MMDFSTLFAPHKRFSAPTMDMARAVILTPDAGETDDRWRVETPWLQGVIRDLFPEPGLYLDYGSGVGRVTRELPVPMQWVHVDTSPDMLRLGREYYGDKVADWIVPDALPVFWKKGSMDGAISIYTLQHIDGLYDALERIRDVLKPSARFLVLNSRERWIPSMTPSGWTDDGQDVDVAICNAGFVPERAVSLDALPLIQRNHFCSVYRKG